MKPSIMIDLETLGTKPGSVISSIGACCFDPHGSWIGEQLHIHVDHVDSVKRGFNIEAETVAWWFAQGDTARQAITAGQAIAYPVVSALEKLGHFVRSNGSEPWIWCNGGSFDFPILAAYFAKFDKPLPWDYWQEMDLRTLKNLNKSLRLERQGTHHDALADAIHQARLVQHILQANPDMDA